METSIPTAEDIRKKIRQLRRSMTKTQQQQAAESVTTQILQHPKITQSRHIALFSSIDGELDTQFLIDELWQQNKDLYLPVLHPFCAGHLLFLHFTPQTPLIINRFNIPEPCLDIRNVISSNRLDIIFTPLVAFDENGNRLGMGGGYYDRFLQHWQEKNCYPIGLAHDFQRVEKLPINDWDIPLPEIITPSCHWCW